MPNINDILADLDDLADEDNKFSTIARTAAEAIRQQLNCQQGLSAFSFRLEECRAIRRALRHALNSLDGEERRVPTALAPLIVNERIMIALLSERFEQHEKTQLI